MFAIPRNNLRAAISKCMPLCLSILSSLVIARHIAFGASVSASLAVSVSVVKRCTTTVQGIGVDGLTDGSTWVDPSGNAISVVSCHKGASTRTAIELRGYPTETIARPANGGAEKSGYKVYADLTFTDNARETAVKVSNVRGETSLRPKGATVSKFDSAVHSRSSENDPGSATFAINF
jgi:hypothetical protein